MSSPVRVLVAEDSVLFAEAISQVLEYTGEIEVVGIAGDGAQAVALVDKLRPDLVLMDVRMPVLDGLGAIEAIMARAPTPVLVMTADPDGQTGRLAFEALRRGALELVPKPESWSGTPDEQDDLRDRVLRLSRVPVIRHISPRQQHRRSDTPSLPPVELPPPRPAPPRAPSPPATRPARPAHRRDDTARFTTRAASPMPSDPRTSGRAVVVAASTGGPVALAQLLAALPAPFPLTILVAQHLSIGFEGQFAQWLGSTSGHRTMVARDGLTPGPGEVWLAPTDAHLKVNMGGVFELDRSDPVAGHRPSADLLMSSAAHALGSKGIGVMLTGMGQDGAQGLLAMRRRGATTYAQSEETCAVFGMPKAAIDLGAVCHVLDLLDIAAAVKDEVEALLAQPAPGGAW